jgi:alkyl sulfatase BDS1-like metallo-beta-lactamase superfamily hydrolase
MVTSCLWEPERDAEWVNDHVLMSRGTSNGYLVAGDAADVVINTGTPYQGERYRQRYEQALGRRLSVHSIIITQSHDDHFGGWQFFTEPGTETVVHRSYPEGRYYRRLLPGFFAPRSQWIIARLQQQRPAQSVIQANRAMEEPTVFVDDCHAFEAGGRRFEVLSVPGGETTDSLAVWIPDEKTIFIGNLDGALWRQLPHLYTIRGDRQRSARGFIQSIERILALEPELLLTGHDEPIRGAEVVRRDLERLRDATVYIHDRTVEGMNAGTDLWTLMEEIELPAELQPDVNRGPVHWYVRAVWEEYAGWFRFESVTELYPVAPSAVWPDLVEMAGGADALAARASTHHEQERPLEALHLTDIALSVDPQNRAALTVRIAALTTLLERAGNNFDELAYLEDQVTESQTSLG